MTDAEWRDDEISLFAVGTTLLRNRRRILIWMMLGGLLAGASVASRKALYLASASFIPQNADAGGRGGLASLAGQFGVSLPAGDASRSPDFYADLLKSHALLRTVARDTFVVQEMGGRRISFFDLFEIRDGSAALRDERGVQTLMGMVGVTVAKSTGIVSVSVSSQWPSVSLAVVSALINGVDEFNRRTRQTQAESERKFVEGRLAVAAEELRATEDRLQEFLQSNVQIGNSQELAFRRERLQRAVMLRQQVFTSLTESYEEVRIREVRDTPFVTLFEEPWVPSKPGSRGRLKVVLLGLVVGAMIGIVLAFISDMLARSRRSGNAEADEFLGTLGELKGQMTRPFRLFSRAARR